MQLLKWVAVLGGFVSAINAKPADQRLFKACPANHGAEKFCCEGPNEDKYILTRYNRPTRDASYDKAYLDGWNMPRQINFPEATYTPNTQSFVYASNKADQLCQLVYHKTANGIQPKHLCGSELQAYTQNTTIGEQFWTHARNPRNNNASSLCLPGYVRTNNIDTCFPPASAKDYVFKTYTELPFLFVYFMFAFFFACLFAWISLKKISQRRDFEARKDSILLKDLEAASTSLITNKQGPVTPSSAIRRSDVHLLEHEVDTEQTGYKSHMFGQFMMALIVFLSVVLNAILVLIVVDLNDIYDDKLFGPGEPITACFITAWAFTSLWFISIVVSQNDISNFFRIKCSLEECEYVYFFKPENEEVLLSDRSGVSDMVARVEKFIFPNRVPGHEETVAVSTTEAGCRVIEFQHVRYYYCESQCRFVPGIVALGETYNDLQKESCGLSMAAYEERVNLVGTNSIEIQMPTFMNSILTEILTYFYIYQLMCYYVWFFFSYGNMGAVMVSVVIISACINIYTKRRMQASVVQMTKYSTQVTVCRDNQWITVDSKEVAPGDLVRVAENWIVPCDMVIVKGATVCDESMLTGESMPVQKFPIPENSAAVYDAEGGGKKHTLFSGTKVLSSGRNEEILALVQTTGAHTSKGQLVQNILYPVPMRFKYDEHLKVIILGLMILAISGCCASVYMLVSNGKLTNRLAAFNYCMCLISTIISPLFPVVLTVGQVNAAKRLEKLGVFALNTQRITLCGKIRVFCFDKTGTLTKQGLDFLGCQPVDANQAFESICTDVQNSQLNKHMRYALASCHAIGSLDGHLVGNQVELKMFEATGWDLLEEENQAPVVENYVTGEKLQVIKRFEFDHHRMSMSVVMRDLVNGKLYVFCKGSYEKMKQLSNDSSLPVDYSVCAESLARDGCYVLGIAVRELPQLSEAELDTLVKNRDLVEEDLSMLGLILFRNELKDDTRDAIQRLKAGDTRVVMITGDNAMCGCYIAKACDMVSQDAEIILGNVVSSKEGTTFEWSNVVTRATYSLEEIRGMVNGDREVELALTGKAFNYLIASGDMDDLLLFTRIFSRMTPDDKIECVKLHMEKGAITGMCGDGGNDCGALRQAHAGIALSDAEASIVSPFTSRPKTITSVVDLCREGRCSVATSFASVKMLITYGIVASTQRLVQYYHGVVLGEWCFILLDGFIMVGLSYVLTLSRPLPELGNQRPTSSLVGPTTLFSIVGQEMINLVFLMIGMTYLTTQDWYCPFSPGSVDLAKWWLFSDNAVATCLFFSIVIQQQTAALVYSFGSRFRLPVWRNIALVGFYVILIAIDLYLMLSPPNAITDFFRIASGPNVVGLPDIPLSFNFRLEYLGIVVSNAVAVICFEHFVILGPIRSWCRKRFHRDAIPMKL